MPIGSDGRTRVAVITGIIGVALLAPGRAASATAGTGTTWYAAPDGAGTACTKAAPCDITSAVAAAPSGSVVIVEPGSYGTDLDPLGATIANGVDGATYRAITVEGDPGKAVPTIHVSANYGVILVNSFLKRVKIVHTGSVGGAELINTVASQIQVDSSGIWGCEVSGSLIDSVCHDTADNGDAVLVDGLGGASVTANLTNVTAVADGKDGVGLFGRALGSSTDGITVVNTIADGDGGGIGGQVRDQSVLTITGTNDLSQSTSASTDATSQSHLTVGATVTQPPVFRDAANSDFHEAAASPSVDAGTPKGVGSVDLDGLPRSMGKAPDIGAYELPAAALVHKAHVTHRESTSLKVAAVVDTQGLPAVATLVAKSGNATVTSHRKSLAADLQPRKVKLKVSQLNPHSQYTLQLVVTDGGGTTTESVSTGHH